MTGDQADFQRRLRLTLPDRWFADVPAVLGGVLAGLGSAWAGLYALLGAVRMQSRLATATDGFLDLAAADYFGGRVQRRGDETDDAFRARIQREMRRARGTRASLIGAGRDLGYAMQVFEPGQPADTGAYSVAGNLAWGLAGGWGSLAMPLESLVTARRVTGADDDILQSELAGCLPAGGVAWLRII